MKASGASTERPSHGFSILFLYHFYLRTWPRSFNELAGKRFRHIIHTISDIKTEVDRL